MIGGYISKVIAACQKRKALFFLSLLFVIAFLVFGLSRLKISENIFSTLPQGKSFEPLNALLEAKNISNNVIFSLDIESLEEEETESFVNSFVDSLKTDTEGYLSDIEAIRQDVDEISYEYFYNYTESITLADHVVEYCHPISRR